MITNLQLLRAIAAYAVVIYHIGDQESAAWFRSLSHVGAAGVDIFFVLSGFIMVFTTARVQPTSTEFLLKRIARIVPTYWLVTLATFALLLLGLRPIGNHQADVGYLVSSLLFFPVERGAAGTIPLVAVGWTLNYEMFFYLLFAAVLALAKNRGVAYTVVGVLLALVSVNLVVETTNPSLRLATSPLLLEFAFGIVLARLWPGALRVSKLTLERVGVGLALAGGAALFVIGVLVPLPVITGSWRFGWFGIPAAAVVAGVVSLEAAGRAVSSRRWLFQGEASYALYLVHPLVLQVTRKVIAPLPLSGTAGLGLRIVVLLLACATASALFYLHVERPLTRLFSRRSTRVVKRVVETSG